jgi:hypothetical protein
MSQRTGRRLALSIPRRLLCDMLHFARQVPSVPVQRRLQLARVAAARAIAVPRPGWCAIFTKALALVAADRPELRRTYLSFPWPHVYEHADSVATVTVERRYENEDAVFFVPIQTPGQFSLARIDARLRHCKNDPVREIGAFRRFLLVGRLPRPLRRLLWWVGLHCLPRKRAALFGTYGVTVYAGLGAASLHPLSVLSTTLNYGVIEPDGSVDVRLVYDHRVLDGATVARALADLEAVLNGPIVEELTSVAGTAADANRAVDPMDDDLPAYAAIPGQGPAVSGTVAPALTPYP